MTASDPPNNKKGPGRWYRPMSQELYAKPAAPVKTASYLVRLRGLPPQRLSMTHRALLAFLQQAGQRRAAAVA